MQQKVMLWMPVIFSSMMLTLPSGLTLYILISTVFGISQQYIFMKDKSPAAVPAKA
jgi:YidC/Oxa1 family membrane protein insertase